MEVKFKRLSQEATIPSYAKIGDAGMDLVATSKGYELNGKTTYGTGIAIEIPKGYVGLLFPRSSISKMGVSLANAVGVIDSGYRGEIKMVFKQNLYRKYSNTSISGENYEVGDKIGQLIILPYPTIELIEVNELQQTDRGEDGFGSTGK